MFCLDKNYRLEKHFSRRDPWFERYGVIMPRRIIHITSDLSHNLSHFCSTWRGIAFALLLALPLLQGCCMFKKGENSPFDTQRGQVPEASVSSPASPCSGTSASPATPVSPPPVTTTTATHDSTVQVIIPDTESTPEGSVTQRSSAQTVDVQHPFLDPAADELLSDPKNTNTTPSSGNSLNRVAPTAAGPVIIRPAGYSNPLPTHIEIPVNNQVTSRIPSRSPTSAASLQVYVTP